MIPARLTSKAELRLSESEQLDPGTASMTSGSASL